MIIEASLQRRFSHTWESVNSENGKLINSETCDLKELVCLNGGYISHTVQKQCGKEAEKRKETKVV